MGILESKKEIKLEDREINLFLNMYGDHQMGHVIIHQREKLSDGFLSHEEDEYLYLIRGDLVAKSKSEEWPIKSGQFNLIPKGVEHVVENIGDTDGEFVFFNIKPLK